MKEIKNPPVARVSQLLDASSNFALKVAVKPTGDSDNAT